METRINYHHAFIFSFPKATFTKMPRKSCNVEIILNNCPKKLVILIRKKISENVKQTHSSQNEGDSRKL